MEISNIKQLTDKIEYLNSRSAQVNTQRNQNIGKREALIAQREKLLKQYKDEYGVDITPETLDEEIARVMAEKEQEASKLENVLDAISRGDYKMANSLMGVEYKDDTIEKARVGTEVLMAETEILHREFDVSGTTAQAQSIPAGTEVQAQSIQSQPIPNANNFPFGGQAITHDMSDNQPSDISQAEATGVEQQTPQPTAPAPQTDVPPVAPQPVQPTAPAPPNPQGIGDMLMGMFGAQPVTKKDTEEEIPPVAPPPQMAQPAPPPTPSTVAPPPPTSNNPMANFSQPILPNNNAGGLSFDSVPAPPPQTNNPNPQFNHLFHGTEFKGN